MAFLIVFLGAGLGGAARHGANLAALRFFGPELPFGTFGVNVLGCFLIGVFAGYWAVDGNGPQHLRLFLVTGLLGGFTTFSAFSLDAVVLFERGAMATSIIYVTSSVLLSITALRAGLWLARSLTGGSL